MPKGSEKELTKLIPRIYKKSAENLMLYTWVTSQRQIIPTITIEQSIWNFFKYAAIEDWDMESAVVTYARMQKEFYEDCRNGKKES